MDGAHRVELALEPGDVPRVTFERRAMEPEDGHVQHQQCEAERDAEDPGEPEIGAGALKGRHQRRFPPRLAARSRSKRRARVSSCLADST